MRSNLNSIGASRVIDYRKAQFEKILREKVDVVFGLIGGDTQKRSFLVLKEGGHLVAATQRVSQEETARHRVSGAMMRLAPSGERLGRIGRLLDRGRYDQTSRPCTHCKRWPRPGRTSPGACQGFMGCPMGRKRQDASHTARSCFVWLRSAWSFWCRSGFCRIAVGSGGYRSLVSRGLDGSTGTAVVISEISGALRCEKD